MECPHRQSELGGKMSFLQPNLTAVTDKAASLVAQLCELNQLRERLRMAQLSTGDNSGRPAEKNANLEKRPRQLAALLPRPPRI
jgi:flagellar biosynthesis/type III secretory pathway chaperone